MKSILFIITLFLSMLNLNAYEVNPDVFHKEKNNTNKEKVDCSDPKNRPRDIGGILRGGKKKSVLLIVARQSALNVIWI